MKLLLTSLTGGVLLCLLACQHQAPKPQLVQSATYQKAAAFLDRQPDSAFYYFNKVTTLSKDSLEIARAYCNMGRIQTTAGDDYGAQESLSLSLRFLHEQNAADQRCLANDYNELGITSTNLKNYDQAINYYDLSIRLVADSNLRLIAMNNKANVYRKKKDYEQALRLYRQVMRATPRSGAAYARVLTNMVITRWRQQPHYDPASPLRKALNIRVREKDELGVNSSYAHLTDFYMQSKTDSALYYASRWYLLAHRLHSAEDQLSSLSALINLSSPGETRRYFVIYHRISDSLQTARNAAKNQFALIRYEAEKNKTENLRLQKDNADKRYQIIKQQAWLGGTLLLIVAAGIITVLWYRKRKQRLEAEAQQAIQQERLKTSQKVHDVVANGLYRLITELEHRSDYDTEALLDKMEILYDQSRDLSYEPARHQQSFAEQLGELLESFGGQKQRVAVIGNHESIWKGVSESVRYEVEHILQELMVNMKKHSEAGLVTIKFERQGQQLWITYTDDGKGLPEGGRHGNGLTNTGNRIKAIQGSITFENGLTKGLQIRISFLATQPKSYV